MLDLQLLENDPSMPSFYGVLITALFSFLLSSLICITYQFTTKSIYRKAHFLQSLALISVVAATVMQAIGDSLARGLGMLGALSIIRFRTVLDDPRNITFMFASLATGISCGVFGLHIAITGTIIFCLAAVVLRLSPLSKSNELIGKLRIQVPKDDFQQAIIEKQLKKHCKNFELDQLRFLNPKNVQTITEDGIVYKETVSRENLQQFTYLIRLNEKSSVGKLTEAINEIEELEDMRLSFNKQPTKL